MEVVKEGLWIILDCPSPSCLLGSSLIDQLIYAQQELLGVSQDIQLVQRLREANLSGQSEVMIVHFAHEVDLEGDIVCLEDAEEEFWSANE